MWIQPLGGAAAKGDQASRPCQRPSIHSLTPPLARQTAPVSLPCPVVFGAIPRAQRARHSPVLEKPTVSKGTALEKVGWGWEFRAATTTMTTLSQEGSSEGDAFELDFPG